MNILFSMNGHTLTYLLVGGAIVIYAWLAERHDREDGR